MFGRSKKRSKNTLANRVRKAEAKARKIERKNDLLSRLEKANKIIRKGK